MTIAETLSKLKEKNEGALAMFAAAGDPDVETSLRVFRDMGENGADILEVGIPYSDPLMDGPVLQRSYKRALGAGFKLRGFPAYIESIKKSTDTPMLVMTCFNPVRQYGVERFFRDITSAGVDSILLTDLPPEEWGGNLDAARRYGLGTIFLLAPTTPRERMRLINEVSDPFVYCISKIGLTGAGDAMPEQLEEYVSKVREEVTKPLLVGFGVSIPEHAAAVCKSADGAVVGSALVGIIERNVDDKDAMSREVSQFVSDLKAVL